jgi:hypothetical protein
MHWWKEVVEVDIGDLVKWVLGGTAFEGRVFKIVAFEVRNGKTSVVCKLFSGEQPDTGHEYPPRVAKKVRYTFAIDQLEVITKAKEITRVIDCPDCNGTGYITVSLTAHKPGTKETCATCGGKGKVKVVIERLTEE